MRFFRSPSNRQLLLAILRNQGITMTALSDLKSAIADLGTQLTANNTEIETLLGKITTPGTSDADIQAAVSDIRALIASNKTEVDKATVATSAALAPGA